MTTCQHEDLYDAIVIGGGPAGSAAGAALARFGRRVLVLERERFPRFHIGESLLPASHEVFEALGVTARVEQAGFVVKRGASFCTEDGERSAYIDFSFSPEVTRPRTFQVPRARFDELMLEHARSCGAEVLQGCRATEVSFRGEGVGRGAAVEMIEEAGRRRKAAAPVVIDASGQSGFLARRLELRRRDDRLNSVAVHAHFEGVPRLEGDRSGDIRIVSLNNLGWIWLIPISAEVTSIGVVLPRAEALELRDEEALEGFLRAVPALMQDLRRARRHGPVRRNADFSYAPRAYTGDGWLLAGDAGSFLDPIFSTGVQLALQSGLEAAEAVHDGLTLEQEASGGDRPALLPRSRLRTFERRLAGRYWRFRRFVVGFYQPAFRDLFFEPSNRFGVVEAVTTALAGISDLSWQTRLRLRIFFALVALQRLVPLVPRRHGKVALAVGAALRPESGLPESGLPESGLPESGLPESGLSEFGLPESGSPEFGFPESGSPESLHPEPARAAVDR